MKSNVFFELAPSVNWKKMFVGVVSAFVVWKALQKLKARVTGHSEDADQTRNRVKEPVNQVENSANSDQKSNQLECIKTRSVLKPEKDFKEKQCSEQLDSETKHSRSLILDGEDTTRPAGLASLVDALKDADKANYLDLGMNSKQSKFGNELEAIPEQTTQSTSDATGSLDSSLASAIFSSSPGIKKLGNEANFLSETQELEIWEKEASEFPLTRAESFYMLPKLQDSREIEIDDSMEEHENDSTGHQSHSTRSAAEQRSNVGSGAEFFIANNADLGEIFDKTPAFASEVNPRQCTDWVCSTCKRQLRRELTSVTALDAGDQFSVQNTAAMIALMCGDQEQSLDPSNKAELIRTLNKLRRHSTENSCVACGRDILPAPTTATNA